MSIDQVDFEGETGALIAAAINANFAEIATRIGSLEILALMWQNVAAVETSVTSSAIDYPLTAGTAAFIGDPDMAHDGNGQLTWNGPALTDVKILSIPSMEMSFSTVVGVQAKVFLNHLHATLEKEVFATVSPNGHEQSANQLPHPMMGVTDLATADAILSTFRNDTNTSNFRQKDILTVVFR